ncbi:hypothetical protein CEXT_492471 [Caerostris extrusa]|uniref:Uncharacterized protein n=1 Tax=Caerostris extrusa TaxID=172846 RepID=A0AAV4NYU0_CAEEX|nr:hypothetical protein CEXT_492471 [Caerostris extrusa]
MNGNNSRSDFDVIFRFMEVDLLFQLSERNVRKKHGFLFLFCCDSWLCLAKSLLDGRCRQSMVCGLDRNGYMLVVVGHADYYEIFCYVWEDDF